MKQMDEMKRIQEIVAMEWDMFQLVQNQGGRASCQDDWVTFEIMRSSQFRAWDDRTRESYWQDLHDAREAGRNLLMEKYARMMERTAPAQYARIEKSLPVLSQAQWELIEEIVAIQVDWEKESAQKYPRLILDGGRPVTKEEERPGETSAETYLRGELATYSAYTLSCYAQQLKELMQEGKNICEMILENTVQRYGYESIAQYEALVGGR